MLNVRFYWVLIALLLLFFSCSGGNGTHSPAIARALTEAGANKGEIKRVLAHYSKDSPDSLKLKAAIFLLENMYLHYSISDTAYRTYSTAILQKTMPISTPALDSLWNRHHKIRKTKDLEHIKAVDLIRDIDEAFAIREQSLWKDSIDFETFLHYCGVQFTFTDVYN